MLLHVNLTGEARNPVGSIAPLDMIVAVGFGAARVARNGKLVVDAEHVRGRQRKRYANADGWVTLRKIEKAARRNPRGRWEITIDAPLWSAVWERKRPGKWVCINAGEGFA